MQQPASNSSRNAVCPEAWPQQSPDPGGGSGADGSPVSWVVEESERERERAGPRWTLMRARYSGSDDGVEGGLTALVPVEPAFWHAAFQEINTVVFHFTPKTHPPHRAQPPNPGSVSFTETETENLLGPVGARVGEP